MVFPCPPRLPAPPQLGCTEYALPGPQVEPAASYWTECRPPCVITIQEILAEGFTLPPYPVYPSPVALDEIEELMELAALRDTPGAIFSNVPGRERRGISPFLQLRPQPLGAVFNKERAHDRCNDRCLDMPECQRECGHKPDDDDVPVILTGRELARYFESETPGLAHRLALNYLLPTTNWSPPRQALVWMALDVAIYSALGAAWYFKWRAPGVSRRPRPIECDYRVSVLYNRAVDCDGDADGERRTMPVPSPGTPRHPAYPSGHSTYAAAASEILSYFFPDYAGEFDDLADNAGIARLWAGIHWRTDHTAGQLLGRFVAQRLIKQLRESCATALPDPCDPEPPCPPIPSIDKLDVCAQECCETRLPRSESDSGRGSGAKTTSAQSRSRSGRGSSSGQGRQGRSSSAGASQASGPQEGAAPTGSRKDEAAQARGPQEGASVSGSQSAEQEAAQGPQEGAR